MLGINVAKKFKFIILVLAAMVILIVATSFLAMNREAGTLKKELQRQGLVLANNLAHNSERAFITEKFSSMMNYVFIMSNEEYVTYVMIRDSDGVIKAHSDIGKMGKTMSNAFLAASFNESGSYIQVSNGARGEQFDIAVPIISQGESVGVAQIGYSLEGLSESVASARKQVLIIALVSVIFGVLCAWFLWRVIANPILTLSKTAKAIAAGDLEKRAEIDSKDEIGELAQSFNRMTESLIEAKDKAETILHSIGDGVFVIDKKYKIVVFNKMAEKISGFTAKEAIGKKYDKILKFVFESTGRENGEFIKRCMNDGEVTDMINHTVIIKKNGLKKPVANSAAPLKNSAGDIIGSVIVFRDVTVSREIDKMKNEFVSVASHQLRTPLTAIKLFSEMLITDSSENLNKNQKEYLSNINECTNRMVRLVNDLLNVARIESGRLKIEPVLTDVSGLVHDILAEVKPMAKERRVKIVFDEKNKLPKVMLDHSLFRQTIHNLTGNAIRYSKDDGGEVKIVLKKEAKDYFVISVSDNGIGIPEEGYDKIFEKFYRANNAIKSVTEGTGLGLYLVKMIIDQAGGEIWFESKENVGTVFYIKLPLTGMKAKIGERGLAFS